MHVFMMAVLALGIADSSNRVDSPAAATKLLPDSTVHLMSAEKDERLRKMLPEVSDADVRAKLNDQRLILYTEREMPRAYQMWSGGLQGIHSAYYNLSANGSEPYGNGNREFPWGSPAGTQRTSGVEVFRFVWLPQDEQGKTLPVVWNRKRLKGDSTTGYAWTFPVGAVVGEVMTMKGPDGYAYTFEMRTRTREYGYWDIDVYRPFPTSGDLARRIKELRPDWQDRPNLVKAIDHLEGHSEMKVLKLADNQPAKRTFSQTMGVDSLPPLGDDRLVAELLSGTTFHSASGEVWRESVSGAKTYAPTVSEAGFSVVPAKYDGGFVEVDRQSCMRCHESVSKPVTDFNSGRDWYGHIRGSDGIFSFHPFSLESVSGNGYGSGVKMRPELEKAGVIAQYDPKRHPESIYQAARISKD